MVGRRKLTGIPSEESLRENCQKDGGNYAKENYEKAQGNCEKVGGGCETGV